jgi:hypothetical protein
MWLAHGKTEYQVIISKWWYNAKLLYIEGYL